MSRTLSASGQPHAPQAGTLREVRAQPGDQVSAGDLLAVIDEGQ